MGSTEPPGWDEDDDEGSGHAVVLAVDPGGTTGWSCFAVHPLALASPDYSVLENVEHWSHGQLVGPEFHQVHSLVDMVGAWPHAAVVFEDFVVRVGGSRGREGRRELLSPVRITAAVGYAVWSQWGRRLWFQSPADAKVAVTDARLRDWKLYEREGGLEHARDADRHALLFLKRAAAQDSRSARLRAAAWPALFAADGSIREDEDEDASEGDGYVADSG